VAPPRYRIACHVESRFRRSVRVRPLIALARRALEAESAPAPGELSVAVTGDATVRDLNQRFRGIDEPTDVLSFDLAGAGFPEADRASLGEIIISFETAARQAAEAGQPIEDELAHLVVHGVLHLLGYDHERPADARRMRAREELLLGRAAH
jgi:probable rRNA maturation factor